MQIKLGASTSFRRGPIEINGQKSNYSWEVQGAYLVVYDRTGKEIVFSATQSGLIERLAAKLED